MKSKPWFKFDPNSWLNNIQLRNCSTSERGMLIDLMCIAHRSTDYGCILQDYKPDSVKMLAKSLSIRYQTATRCIQKLIELERISLTSSNQLVIERMVEDEEKARQQSAYGKMGGNPTLNPDVKIEKTKTIKDKEKDKMYEVAKVLATDLLSKTSKALGRPLTNGVVSSAKGIQKLLKKGITEGEILNTMTWLTTDNTQSEYAFVVHSGNSLHDKWDKIQSAMCKKAFKKKRVENAI